MAKSCSTTIIFHERPPQESLFGSGDVVFSYVDINVSLGSFHLSASGSEIHAGEVIGILGANGIGKTTFMKASTKRRDPYHKLSKVLNRIPNGFPMTKDGTHIRLLQWIFEPEEAELASKMKLSGETIEKISKR